MTPALPVTGSWATRFCTLAAIASALVACAAQPDARNTYRDPDCAQPFETQSAALVAQDKLVAAPVEPAEPYRFYSSADGRSSYLITQPAAPAHPAIMMQKARGTDVITTGCAYGDQAAYDQLLDYLDGLKTWTRR